MSTMVVKIFNAKVTYSVKQLTADCVDETSVRHGFNVRHVRKIDRADDADAACAADAMPDVTATIDAPSIVYII